LLPKRAFDIAHRQPIGCETVAIDPQPHRITRTADVDGTDAGDGLQAGERDTFDDLGDFQPRVAVGVERKRDDRAGVGLGLRSSNAFERNAA
jgi:hypothetical protein